MTDRGEKDPRRRNQASDFCSVPPLQIKNANDPNCNVNQLPSIHCDKRHTNGEEITINFPVWKQTSESKNTEGWETWKSAFDVLTLDTFWLLWEMSRVSVGSTTPPRFQQQELQMKEPQALTR